MVREIDIGLVDLEPDQISLEIQPPTVRELMVKSAADRELLAAALINGLSKAGLVFLSAVPGVIANKLMLSAEIDETLARFISLGITCAIAFPVLWKMFVIPTEAKN